MTAPDPNPGSNINTAGGAYIEGGVNTGGGNFAGRDMNIYSRSQLEELRDYLEAAVARYAVAQQQRVFKARAQVPPVHPYKLLDWFDLEDTNNFYGRDDAVQKVQQLVLKQRLTVVHAKSGAGKTSLLNAGLAPRLIEDGRLPIFARAFQDPVLAVKRAIAPSTSERPWPELLGSLTLHDFLRVVCRYLPPGIDQLVLLLDQFEEFFVFFPLRAQRQPFIADFAGVYADKNLPVHTVISLRKDYYSDLAEFESYFPAVFKYHVHLEPLNQLQAAQAITAPAARLARPVSYSPELLDALLGDLGSSDMELPHLQIICTKLYEDVLAAGANSIDLPAYERLGRAPGILGNYLNGVLSRLPGRGETIAKAILKQLVSSEATKRMLPYGTLVSRVNAEPGELDDTLHRLVNARLLRRDEVENEIVYEMAHEYLIAEIKLWIDASDLEFKQVEELLAREVINWRLHRTLIPYDRLELIYAQLARLGRIDDETGECLLRSAVESYFEVEEWMRCIAITNIQPLLVLLQDSSPESASTKARRHAARLLGPANDTRAVAPLIAALKDADRAVRTAAAEALGQLGDAVAVAPLIAALKDVHGVVRTAAAEALGQLGDAAAVASLITALEDADRGVRRGAAEALGQLGDAAAVAPLIAALGDEDGIVRRGAAEALGLLGDAAVAPLIVALNDADGEVRRGAVEALGKLGDAAAVAPLIAALKDADRGLRTAAAVALGQLGDAAVALLIAALKDADGVMRRGAAEVLGQLGDAAVAPLIAALADADGVVRRGAAVALGQLGDAAAVAPLIAALNDEDKGVSRGAAVALGQLGDAAAVVPLIAALNDEDKGVSTQAAWLLGRLGDAAAVAPLIAAIKDADGDVRRGAAWSLGQLGDAAAVAPLIAAIKDADWVVRMRAAEALGKLGDAAAVAPLIAALKNADGVVRTGIVEALRKLGDAAVVPLIAALKDADKGVHRAAAMALKAIGTPEALEALDNSVETS